MICPVIGLLMLAIVSWLVVSGLKMRELAKAPAFACGRCGHFLSTGQLQCPECGTIWTNEWIEKLEQARKKAWGVRLSIAGVLLTVILVAVGLAIADLVMYANKAKSNPNQPISPTSSPSAASTSAP